MTSKAYKQELFGGDKGSSLISRNITVMGNRTSIRLEPEMWQALQEIAALENCKTHDICTLIAMRKRGNSSLTAAIRVFIMLYYKAASTEEGHLRANHGSFEKMMMRAKINGEERAFFNKGFKIPNMTLASVKIVSGHAH